MSDLIERFLEGTNTDALYLPLIHGLIADGCAAESVFSVDELEQHARRFTDREGRFEKARQAVHHAVQVATWWATVQLDGEVDAILGEKRTPDSPLKEMADEAFNHLELEAAGQTVFASPWRCDLDGKEFRYVIKQYPFTTRRGIFKEYEGDRFEPVSSSH